MALVSLDFEHHAANSADLCFSFILSFLQPGEKGHGLLVQLLLLLLVLCEERLAIQVLEVDSCDGALDVLDLLAYRVESVV
jgi:hypothetical protein